MFKAGWQENEVVVERFLVFVLLLMCVCCVVLLMCACVCSCLVFVRVLCVCSICVYCDELLMCVYCDVILICVWFWYACVFWGWREKHLLSIENTMRPWIPNYYDNEILNHGPLFFGVNIEDHLRERERESSGSLFVDLVKRPPHMFVAWFRISCTPENVRMWISLVLDLPPPPWYVKKKEKFKDDKKTKPARPWI